jgi:hypothetical protein
LRLGHFHQIIKGVPAFQAALWLGGIFMIFLRALRVNFPPTAFRFSFPQNCDI